MNRGARRDVVLSSVRRRAPYVAVAAIVLAVAALCDVARADPWRTLGGPALAPGHTGPHGAVVHAGARVLTATAEELPHSCTRAIRVWGYDSHLGIWRPIGNPLNHELGRDARNPQLAASGPNDVFAAWEERDHQGVWQLHVNRLVLSHDGTARWMPLGDALNLDSRREAADARIVAADGRLMVSWVESGVAYVVQRQGDRWQLVHDGREWREDRDRFPQRAPRVALTSELEFVVAWLEGGAVRQVRWTRGTARRVELNDLPPAAADDRAGLSLLTTGLFAYTGPLGEINLPFFTDTPPNIAAGVGPASQPVVALIGDHFYLAFRVMRPAGRPGRPGRPLSVGRIVVMRYAGRGLLERLPDPPEVGPYGHQTNPSLLAAPGPDGHPMLVYDVQEPGDQDRVVTTTRAIALD